MLISSFYCDTGFSYKIYKFPNSNLCIFASSSLLPSEELGALEQRGTKCHHGSVLDFVLSSLCPAHCSLLYQILKLAYQEKLLYFRRSVGQTESYCCPCGINPQDNVNPLAVQLSECKAHNKKTYYLLSDCEHQGHASTVYHPGESKSNCSAHRYPLKDCKSRAALASSYCCVKRCSLGTYTVMCPKRLHCISCQSLAIRHNNLVCSFASSPSLSNPSSLCSSSSSLCPSSSICCNQHNPYSCPCYSNHACSMQVRNALEVGAGDEDRPCPVLKMEHSLSPPPLSPVSSDISKKTDEKPPSLLHHGQDEEGELIVKNGFVTSGQHEADVDTATEEELQRRTPRSSPAEHNPSRTLQDVVTRFSKKLDTINPLEKDPNLVSPPVDVSEKEQPQSPSTSQNLECCADAHLTEIITKVLHKGSASDYSLSELFNRHDSTEPKSPNTRSRRRQEVRAAIATPIDDASTRRKSLKIKRELAMLDHYSGRRVLPAKRARLKDKNVIVPTSHSSSYTNLVKNESKKQMVEATEKNHRVGEEQPNMLSASRVTQAVVSPEDDLIRKAEEKEREISRKEKDITSAGTQIPTHELQSKYVKDSLKCVGVPKQVITVSVSSAKQCIRSCEEGGQFSTSDKNPETASDQSSDNIDCHRSVRERQNDQSNHFKDERRSKRNIVPPQRFSSYVTEPRKMFYVACFDDSIFTKRTQKGDILACSTLEALSKDPDATNIQPESENEAPLFSPEHVVKLDVESAHIENCGQFHTTSKDQCKLFPQTLPTKDTSPGKHISDSWTDCKNDAARPFVSLRSSSKTLQISKKASMPQNVSNLNFTNTFATSAECPASSDIQYTSPIKLMFVSPVKDKEGVRYCLKSAACGSSVQAEEDFDPCEVSSWSGTPEKPKKQSGVSATLQVKSVSSPLKSTTSPTRSACLPTQTSPSKSVSSPGKSATSTPRSASSHSKFVSSHVKSATSTPGGPKSASSSAKSASSCNRAVSSSAKSATSTPKSTSSPAKSASSPNKSVSSPAKSDTSTPKSPRKSVTSSPKAKSPKSPKSASPSPKIGSRKAGEVTPTKRVAGTESQRSPCDLSAFHETTPPKRRPGRPKKLGPQLEQKVKRPIGRPRKQKAGDSVIGAKTVSEKSVVASDVEENVNKNLKITVVYGRSRRNKRMVSECLDQLQTEFHDAWQAVGLKSSLRILTPSSKHDTGVIETASAEMSEQLNFVSPVKESSPQSSSNIKCLKQDNSMPLRKPGRPAKVKISGISVTVNTVSPRQRKIQLNRDTLQFHETIHKKVQRPQFKSAKDPGTISHHSMRRDSQREKREETKDDKVPNQPVTVRHSMRVRKPSIHFLHALATSTSRSYSHSNALLRRSKQLLLNKASNERRKEEQQSSVGNSGVKKQPCGHEKNISQDLSRVAGMSIDSIFTPKEILRWWVPSAEDKIMNQELARRIRLISDTWVSDTVENQEKEVAFNSKLGNKSNSLFTKKSKNSSVVRTLFNCSPNKPRSCSMQQLCSWFMQTTETQSLAIVKKASSRNPYELMHFPRSVNKKSICHSPQAERLRKHMKKFAKTVPISPLQHHRAQRRLEKRKKAPPATHRRQLFTCRFAAGSHNQEAQWWGGGAFCKYQAILFRAKIRFLNQKEREKWQKKQMNKNNQKAATGCSNGREVSGLQSKHKTLFRSVKRKLSDCLENGSVDQTQDPGDVPKEQNICSKAWSPETLKECRVFLRKINSPDNESTEEEWNSCTVTLDDGSPSAYLFAGRDRELVGVVKAVKTERKRSLNSRIASRELMTAPNSCQEQDGLPAGRQKGKYKGPGVVSAEQPPAKMLRQSRTRGLSRVRWCDFVFGKYLVSFN